MAREVAVEWFESVALIQAVCTQIVEADKGPDGFPTAADLLLLHDGSVTVVRIPAGENAAHAAARMVADLGSGAFPVQLRLALSQAAAGESSLSTFSDALSFFERPNRQDTLRQLYQRAALAPAKPQLQAEVPAPAAVQVTSATPQAPKKKKKAPTGRLVVAVVGVAAVSTSLLLFGFGAGKTHIRGAIGSVQESVREKLGIPSSSTSSEPVEKPGTSTPSEARGTATARRSRVQDAARRPLAAITSGTSAFPISPVPMFAGLDLAPLPRSAFSARLEAITISAHEAVTVEPESRVYSLKDSDVTPPRPVYPQLPSPDTVRNDATVVELLIGTNGLVEHVKMRTVPRTIHDVMLLSAAKAWRFDPATISGSPVRFLYRVAIAP